MADVYVTTNSICRLERVIQAFCEHFDRDRADAEAEQAAKDAAALRQMWAASWFFGKDTPEGSPRDKGRHEIQSVGTTDIPASARESESKVGSGSARRRFDTQTGARLPVPPPRQSPGGGGGGGGNSSDDDRQGIESSNDAGPGVDVGDIEVQQVDETQVDHYVGV